MSSGEKSGGDVRETARIEAFSDGVFAIAITLLVLDIKVPRPEELGGGLLAALLARWPMYLAFFSSFATILVMWVNHHELFGHIRRVDRPFLFWNGLLLLFVTFVPFPTALLSEYVRRPQARDAALVHSGTFVATAIAFNLLWRYASGGGRLLARGADLRRVEVITRQYAFGPPVYLFAFVVAFVSVAASVGVCVFLAVFFAFTGAPGWLSRGPKKARSAG